MIMDYSQNCAGMMCAFLSSSVWFG